MRTFATTTTRHIGFLLFGGFSQLGDLILGDSSAFALLCIDEDDLVYAVGQIVAIPEAAIVRKPMRTYAVLENLVLRERLKFAGALVILGHALSVQQRRSRETEREDGEQVTRKRHIGIS